MSCVLDAWAIIALLKDEAAAETVQSWVEERGARISWINLGEVLYLQTRRVGAEAAQEAVEAVARSVVAELPDEELVVAAARVKAEYSVSYADAFAVATAERHGIPLLTGDPELVALKRRILEVHDLRS